MICDVTCVDTLVNNQASQKMPEELNGFIPIAVKSFRSFGLSASELFNTIAKSLGP